jgi:hypothetical protein
MDVKIWELVLNKPLMAALSAQLSSQVFKVFLPVFRGKPPDLTKIADYGGIPSAHTAFISGVTIAIGLTQGWTSPLTALAGVLSGILIYDILKMRKAVEISLAMGEKALKNAGLEPDEKSPQFKGHSVVEVVAGIAWGTLCAWILCALWK